MSTKPTRKKIRVTLDVTPPFFERLEQLEELADASTKAALIRQALEAYEYLVKRTKEGYRFKAVSQDGHEESIVFVGTGHPPA